TFWLMTLAFVLLALSAAAIRVHFIPFLVHVGVQSSTAALAAGAIGITQVAGRVFFAPLDRIYATPTLTVTFFAMQALAMLVLLAGQSLWLIGGFILFFGAAQGALTL